MTTVVNVIELVTLPLMRSNKLERLYMASFLSLFLYLRARLEPTQEEHLSGEPYPGIASRNIKLSWKGLIMINALAYLVSP